MDSLKEFFSLFPERYADFITNVVGGLEILLFSILICVALVYLSAMFIAMGGRTAKFTKRIMVCNKEMDQIKMVDKSNRRIFYGILNKAPVSIKKSWENYEYFKTNRAVDYFNKSDLLATAEHSNCGKSILMAFNFILPMFMFMSTMLCYGALGWSFACGYTGIVLVFEFVLYLISAIVNRSRANKAEYVLDKFLENLNAKANIHGSGDNGKTLSQLAEKTVLGSAISNVSVEDKSKVLNDNLVDKAIGNKSLNKNERQAIVNSIESQKQINKAIVDKKADQPSILQPKAYWGDNKSSLDSILEEIEQLKSNDGNSMKDIQRLLEALQVEKSKPNKSEDEKKKLNEALNELLQILSKEKNKKA